MANKWLNAGAFLLVLAVGGACGDEDPEGSGGGQEDGGGDPRHGGKGKADDEADAEADDSDAGERPVHEADDEADGSDATDGGSAPGDGPDAARGAPCVMAGGTDADGDGHCAGADDCNDHDPAAYPGAVEQCTQRAPADEDCDGLVDDGCAWNFGTRHFLSSTVPNDALWQVTPTVSPDGLRLYFVEYHVGPGGRLFVSHRSALDQPFGSPTQIAMSGLPAVVSGCSVTPDELELVCSATNDAGVANTDLYQLKRSAADAPFGPAVFLSGLSTSANETDPTFGSDGQELFFMREGTQQVILRARRNAQGSFTSADSITMDGIAATDNLRAPHLLADGRTFMFTKNLRLYSATRADLTSAAFTDLKDTGLSALNEWFHEPTRELFLVRSAAWDYVEHGYTLWRARVCRDGACTPEREATCPAQALFSPDRFHCYYRQSATLTWSAAEASCVAADGHLASIHSPEENALIAAVAAGTNAWVGLRDATVDNSFGWTTGETAPYRNWLAPSPDVADAGYTLQLSTNQNMWDDVTAAQTAPSVCEHTVWPTW